MSENNSAPIRSRENTATQNVLDGLVVNVELTLISIIQGVALYFLADTSRHSLLKLDYAVWPYILSGLTVIFLFWSRSVIHTLTVIRWPLDFGHNFLYIACTLIEAVAFTQVADPKRWYALNAVFGVMIWLLFVFDMRLIRRRIRDSAGPVGSQMYAIVEKEQFLNIWLLVPGMILYSLLSFMVIDSWPDVFLDNGYHLYLGIGQVAAALGYLGYVLRFFQKLLPMISRTQQEWRDDVLV